MKEGNSVGEEKKRERRWEMRGSLKQEEGRSQKWTKVKKEKLGTMQHKCMREAEIWHYKFLL